MNSEVIALIVAIVSFLILVFFVCKKIPKIKEIPESESIFLKKEVKEKVKSKIKRITKKGTDFFENFLHKFLSRVRILSLKADKKLSDWILKLRERSKKKKIDSYWSEIKESISKKK